MKYKHRNGGRYQLVGLCIIEANWETGVKYIPENGGPEIVRPASEFFDGRFKLLSREDEIRNHPNLKPEGENHWDES